MKKTDRQITNSTTYIDSVVKIIPSEFVAAYLVAHNAIGSAELPDQHQHNMFLVVAMILLVIQPFYLRRLAGVVNISQVFVSCICFVV